MHSNSGPFSIETDFRKINLHLCVLICIVLEMVLFIVSLKFICRLAPTMSIDTISCSVSSKAIHHKKNMKNESKTYSRKSYTMQWMFAKRKKKNKQKNSVSGQCIINTCSGWLDFSFNIDFHFNHCQALNEQTQMKNSQCNFPTHYFSLISIVGRCFTQIGWPSIIYQKRSEMKSS